MMMGETTVKSPSHFQGVPGASFSIAPKVPWRLRRPIIVSAKKMGRTRMKLDSMYTMMKAAPPCSPTM